MTSTERKVLTRLGIAFVLFAAFGILATEVSQVFIVGVILAFIAGATALMAVSCPKCSYPVLLQKQRVFGQAIQTFLPFPIPKVCPNCNETLP